MSQALLAYSLPKGAQVLVPALDEKVGECLPIILLNDTVSGSVLENHRPAGIMLSKMPVRCDDVENVGVNCSAKYNDLQHKLETNSCEHSHTRCLKYVNKKGISNSAVIVNSGDGELIEMNRSRNNVKDCEIGIEVYGDDSICENNENIHSFETDNTVRSENIVTCCGTIESEDVSLQNMLETCESVGILVKDSSNNCAQAGLEVSSDTDNFENDKMQDKSLRSHGKLNINENMRSTDVVNTSKCEYVNIRDRSPTEEIVLLNSSVVPTADTVLKEMCRGIVQCVESEGLKSGEFPGRSTSSIILDNIDEFAEMVTMFKCRLCKFAAGSKDDLLKHLQIEHLEGPREADSHEHQDVEHHVPQTEGVHSETLVFLCGQCSAGFNCINACKIHMMQVHELIVQEKGSELYGNRSRISDIEMSASKDQVLDTSMDPKTMCIKQKYPVLPAPIKCSVRGCQNKFSEEKDLYIHINCHTGEENCRDFRCCECQTPFERWRSCAMHLWKVHNIDCGLLTCPICLKYKTATSVPLENHMRIHKEDRSFTCPECGKGFKQAAQLHNHRVMHLNRKSSELPRWYASKQCNICLKNYANSKCLKKHIQAVHSKLRPYVCQVCGHASARKAMLQLHYRQHTGEKPHTCPLCEYRTGDHNSLRRHIMRHTGQRPYRCPHCPYSAIQSNSYKNHMRNKHPGKNGVYSCQECSFKTVSHEGFLLHVSDHKNGIISSCNDGDGSSMEVFPGNVAAAQLIYRCLNALSDGANVEANVTGSSTSADGTTQTITIQIPNQDCNSENEDEVTRCFLEVQQQLEEGTVDACSVTHSEMSDKNVCQITK